MTDTVAAKTQQLLAQLHWVDAPLDELLDRCQSGLLKLELSAESEAFESVRKDLVDLKYLLEILNIHGGEVLTSEVIATGEYFAQQNFENSENLDVLFQSMVKLSDYLDFVRVYGYDHGMVLIDTINQLRESRKSPYLHEGILFDVEIVNSLPEFAEPIKKKVSFDKARSKWQRSLRDWLEIHRTGKTADNAMAASAMESIRSAVDALRSSSDMPLNVQLWFLCGEVIEAILAGSNNEDIRLDRLFARLDTYLSKQSKPANNEEDEGIVTELIRSLLYFLSSCEPRTKRLKQVCDHYALTDVISLNSLAAARKSLKGSNKRLVQGIAAAVQTELQGLRERIDQIKLHEEKISAKNYQVLIEDLQKELRRFAGSMELLNYKQTAASIKSLSAQLQTNSKKNNTQTIEHLIEKLLGVEARLFEDGNTRDGFSAKQRITNDSLKQAYDLGIIQLDRLQLKFDTIIKQRAGGAEINADELQESLLELHRLASALNVMGEHSIAGQLQSAGSVIFASLQESDQQQEDRRLTGAAVVVACIERYLIAKRDNLQTADYSELIAQTLSELDIADARYETHPSFLSVELSSPESLVTDSMEQIDDKDGQSSQPAESVSADGEWLVDDELFAIYSEELDEVIAVLDEQVPILANYPDDGEALTTIRRSFHTLKGSSRMIGANNMGQLGAASEFLMNAVIAGEVPVQTATPVIQSSHQQVKFLRDALINERHNTLTDAARKIIIQAEDILGTSAEDSVLMMPAFPVGSTKSASSDAATEAQETEPEVVLDDTEQLSERVEGIGIEEPYVDSQSDESISADTDAHEAASTDEEEAQSVFDSYPALPAAGWDGDERLLELIVDELKTNIERLDSFHTNYDQQQLPDHEGGQRHSWQVKADEIIRATHTIAGALGLANQASRQHAAQATEEYLCILRDQEIELPSDGLTLIRELVDNINQVMQAQPADDADGVEEAEAIADKAKSLLRAALPQAIEEDVADELVAEAAAVIDKFDLVESESIDQEVVAEETQNLDPLAVDPFEQKFSEQLDSSQIFIDSPFSLDTDRSSELFSSADVDTKESADERYESAQPISGADPQHFDTDQLPTKAAIKPSSAEASAAVELAYDEMDDELLHVFMDEADEISHTMHDNMQRWQEAGERSKAIAGLRRNMHTMKGAANMAGLTIIGQQCDVLENQLELSALTEQQGDFESIERSLDHLQEMLSAIKKRSTVPGPMAQPDWPKDIPSDKIVDEFTAQTAEDQVVDADQLEFVRQNEWSAGDSDIEASITDSSVLEPGAPGQRRTVRVASEVLERMGNTAGEVSIFRARIEQLVRGMRSQISEAAQTIDRLRNQLRNLELETEAQILARHQSDINDDKDFDPLELDRYSTIQQLSRSLAESANDLLNLNDSLENNLRQSEGILSQQANVSAELQDDLLQTRMVSIQTLEPRLQQVVRRAAQQSNKSCQLTIDSGTGSELDRNILEQITPSLEHILRNAVAHGIESPSQRMLTGKSEKGQIHLSVVREMTELVIKIRDDGAGLDREKIRQAALSKGLLGADSNPSAHELDQLIFSPGFSTAGEVSEIAGRGIGMDVVRTTVRQVGGNIDIDSAHKQGTTFSIRIPVTLALMQAVVIESHERFFAIPVVNLLGVTKIPLEDYLQAVEQGQLKYAGEEYELYDIERILGQQPTPLPQGLISLLIVESGGRRVALRVAELRRHQELVVKSIGPFVTSIPGITSGAISPEGDVILIIDVGALVRVYLQRQSATEDMPAEQIARRLPMILVVDDSITMRKVTSRVLEHNEMEVNTAKDGLEALEAMKERSPDLVLLDIEMPRMDGFELATYMKNDSQLRKIPIVIISSRSGEKHKQRAMEIGVNDFIGKPYQERELLTTVNQLLEQNPQFAGQLQRGES